jgi:hypothetical protein
MIFKKKKLIKRIVGGPQEHLTLSDIFDEYLSHMSEYNLKNQKFSVQALYEKSHYLSQRLLIESIHPRERNDVIKKFFPDDDVYIVFKSHSNRSNFKSLLISYYIYDKTMHFIKNPTSDFSNLKSIFINLPELINSMTEHQMIELLVEPLLKESSDFRSVLGLLNYQVVEQ